MLGAIIGDIVGSRFEFCNLKSKEFELFTPGCSFTDDTVMSAAVASALLSVEDFSDNGALEAAMVREMRRIGSRYPNRGYGGRFYHWLLLSDDPKPYGSYGNGSAMRVSPCGWITRDAAETARLAACSANPTHNHAEGIRGAVVTALAIRDARAGLGKEAIRRHAIEGGYDLDFTLDGIRGTYMFNETCQGTVPQAIVAFLEADDFEDAIRNAISIGGDSDTLAAITGAIAEAYFGIPQDIADRAMEFLDTELLEIVDAFEARFGSGIVV